MKILFVGSEEEYNEATITRENGKPFSLFYCAEYPSRIDYGEYDAIVIPALRFISYPCGTLDGTFVASGSARLADECFDAGCSDFIREPWQESELHARVKARNGRKLSFDGGKVSVKGSRLCGPSGSTHIGESAYRILSLLASNEGHPVPRQAIAAILGTAFSDGRAIDMRIARLRAMLRAVGAANFAATLRCEHGEYQFSP